MKIPNGRSVHSETHYGKQTLGLEILFSGPNIIETSEKLRYMLYNFTEDFLEAVRLELKVNDEGENIARAEMVDKLRSCFPALYTYEIIANEYCGKSCCYARPWLRVMTPKGPLKIGWRKRVINLDWSEFLRTAKNDFLDDGFIYDFFKADNTTVGDTFVHAWGYEKASEYIEKLLA